MDQNISKKNIYNYLNEISTEDFLRYTFNIQFSKCLVKRRKMLGLSQEELAKKSDVNRVTIAKIETRQRLASIDVILKLLDALDLEIKFVEQTEEAK